ncbi:tetratricopeptide repeat protein [Flavobacteriales bacterium]|nr:tetratricopeptide repeat protein [Flavobacteriales bacterium]
MRKEIITIILLAMNIITFAQKHNIVNASIALRNENYAEAKQYIDEAFEAESTSNAPKMWNYRAPIYLQIALKEPALDEDAALKATEAHIKCLQKDKKGRVVVRKWTSEEDILAGLIQCGYKLFNIAIEKYNAEDYSSSLKYYNAIFEIIPLDTKDQLKRGNITRETILYNSFFSSRRMKDSSTSKNLLQQLIDINFNEPSIFIHMSNIYIEEENTEKALEYLALGRDMFEDDQGLINTEINLYIQLGRTSELIGKLGEAIALDEENDLLYFNRGTIYDQEGDLANAEKDYSTALNLNPSAFGANYNLGALYFNKGVEKNNKANVTSNNSVYKELKKEAEAFFSKALPYLETAHELKVDDKNTLLSLKQLYYLNGDYEKSEEMKKLIIQLK